MERDFECLEMHRTVKRSCSEKEHGEKVIVELSALINNSVKPLQVYDHHDVMWGRKGSLLHL